MFFKGSLSRRIIFPRSCRRNRTIEIERRYQMQTGNNKRLMQAVIIVKFLYIGCVIIRSSKSFLFFFFAFSFFSFPSLCCFFLFFAVFYFIAAVFCCFFPFATSESQEKKIRALNDRGKERVGPPAFCVVFLSVINPPTFSLFSFSFQNERAVKPNPEN